MAIEKASILNSMKTLLVNDSDLSKYELFLTSGKSGVLFSDPVLKTEFGLTGTTNPSISSGSAVIVCTRATSTPIANQKIAVKFDLQGPKAFTNAVNGSKLFIEINQTLINDPTLIEDNYPSTDYALGLNIGTLNMATSYPATNSYIALYTYNGTIWTDVRTSPTVDGKNVDLTALVGNITTTGNIQATNITATGNVTTSEPTLSGHATTKNYVDTNILQAVGTEALVDKDTYILGEDCAINDSLFPETAPTFAESTSVQNIGDVTANTRLVLYDFGSGVSGNTKKLSLRKFTSPSADLSVRFETLDGSGNPTGTLVNANATATVTGASLTTSLVDTTVTFAGSFTIPKGQKYAIVLNQVGNAVNGTNYYGVGYVARDTTTRQAKTWNGTVWSAGQTNRFYYTSSTLALPTVLSKTDADFSYKLPTDFPRIANEAKSAGQNVICTYYGLKGGFSGLTAGATYGISGTAGGITTSTVTNGYGIGEALDTTTIFIKPVFANTSQTNLNCTTTTGTVSSGAYLATYDTDIYMSYSLASNGGAGSSCSIAISNDGSSWMNVLPFASDTRSESPSGTTTGRILYSLKKGQFYKTIVSTPGFNTASMTLLSIKYKYL